MSTARLNQSYTYTSPLTLTLIGWGLPVRELIGCRFWVLTNQKISMLLSSQSFSLDNTIHSELLIGQHHRVSYSWCWNSLKLTRVRRWINWRGTGVPIITSCYWDEPPVNCLTSLLDRRFLCVPRFDFFVSCLTNNSSNISPNGDLIIFQSIPLLDRRKLSLARNKAATRQGRIKKREKSIPQTTIKSCWVSGCVLLCFWCSDCKKRQPQAINRSYNL